MDFLKMRQQGMAVAMACVASFATSVAVAQDQSGAIAKDVIFARKTLMNSIMGKMDWIAEMISQGNFDLGKAHEQADHISVVVVSLTNNIPPNSNQWKENAILDPATDTVASPDIWDNFADFYRRSAAAAKTADEMRRADGEDEVKRLNRALGIACDACHSLYLKE